MAVSWLPGQILGAFDMQGRRADDPNDRIRHEDRRSLRASFLLVAWLAIFDASAINTLDSYVEEDGRHFVRHYMIDFGAGIGSATNDVKGPHDGRATRGGGGPHDGVACCRWGCIAAPTSRSGTSGRSWWRRTPRSAGSRPNSSTSAQFRTNRKVPAHRRMTARDAYWGAKLVTSFSDAQIAAVVGAARLAPGEAAYLEHALRVRRDLIGRRFLTAVTAVEAPAVVAATGAAARASASTTSPSRAGTHRRRASATSSASPTMPAAGWARSTVPAQGAHSCIPGGRRRGRLPGGRDQRRAGVGRGLDAGADGADPHPGRTRRRSGAGRMRGRVGRWWRLRGSWRRR